MSKLDLSGWIDYVRLNSESISVIEDSTCPSQLYPLAQITDFRYLNEYAIFVKRTLLLRLYSLKRELEHAEKGDPTAQVALGRALVRESREQKKEVKEVLKRIGEFRASENIIPKEFSIAEELYK